MLALSFLLAGRPWQPASRCAPEKRACIIRPVAIHSGFHRPEELNKYAKSTADFQIFEVQRNCHRLDYLGRCHGHSEAGARTVGRSRDRWGRVSETVLCHLPQSKTE